MSRLEPELAFAVSARSWSDGLHRFLADHGGARVRITAIGPDDLLGESFDILVIDDICSFLTPRLVGLVRAAGKQVIGVYDPREFADGKDRLLECGVGDVVESSAHPDEFLAVIGRVVETVDVEDDGAVFSVAATVERSSPASGSRLTAITGASGGVGSSEVAIAIAHSLAVAGGKAVLVDADLRSPSLAQRLGLDLHPNVRTAVDEIEFGSGAVETLVQSVKGGLSVLPGVQHAGDWSELRADQVTAVVRRLCDVARNVVVDAGSQHRPAGPGSGTLMASISTEIFDMADRVVAVGTGTPVGVTRLIDWISTHGRSFDGAPVDVLINRAPRDRYRRSELIDELTRTFRPASLAFLPDDRRLEQGAWNGSLVGGGRFHRAVDRWTRTYALGGSQ